MKITDSNWFKTSFASLDTSLGGIGERAENADKAEENPDSKRIKEIQDALRQLEVRMNPRQMTKKASAEKIGMLQRRLMELKQLLLYATPAQAKALARELKSIAGELASAAKAIGGSSATSVETPVVPGADAASALGQAEAVQSADAQAAAGATAEATEAADITAVQGRDAGASQSDKVAQKGAGLFVDQRSVQSPDSVEISDKDLKNMLQEARKLLQEAIAMLKLKMSHGDKESRKDLEDAENKLREIGLSMQTQVASASLYTSRGIGTPDIGGADGLASIGANLNAEA